MTEKWICLCVLQGRPMTIQDENDNIKIWKSKEAIKKHALKSPSLIASDVVFMLNIETGETDTL